MEVSFLSFFFLLSYILRLGAKEAGNPEMPKGADIKKERKKENLLSLAKG